MGEVSARVSRSEKVNHSFALSLTNPIKMRKLIKITSEWTTKQLEQWAMEGRLYIKEEDPILPLETVRNNVRTCVSRLKPCIGADFTEESVRLMWEKILSDPVFMPKLMPKHDNDLFNQHILYGMLAIIRNNNVYEGKPADIAELISGNRRDNKCRKYMSNGLDDKSDRERLKGIIKEHKSGEEK